jgi:hypothetical protein
MAVDDVLMPGGKPIGQPGASPDIREVPGGQKEAEDLFNDLTQGGVLDPKSTHPILFRVPGKGTVGYRPVSKNNGPPTIDVNIAGIPIRKIKFV